MKTSNKIALMAVAFVVILGAGFVSASVEKKAKEHLQSAQKIINEQIVSTLQDIGESDYQRRHAEQQAQRNADIMAHHWADR